MNKNILIKIIIIAVIILISGGAFHYWILLPNQKDNHGCLINKGYSWCDFKNKCIKQGEEDCKLTQEWILDEAKKIIGLDINIMPGQVVKWNTKDGEIAFSAKGFVYTDILGAEKIVKSYNGIDSFLKQIGFEEDSYNFPVNSEKEKSVKYKNGKIICALSQTNNPNNTSSLSIFCGNTNDRLCDFSSDCGRNCSSDSDCDLIVDGCRKTIVCRTRGYKFYHDCKNPTSTVADLDVSINSCICLENQCLPENEKLRDKN